MALPSTADLLRTDVCRAGTASAIEEVLVTGYDDSAHPELPVDVVLSGCSFYFRADYATSVDCFSDAIHACGARGGGGSCLAAARAPHLVTNHSAALIARGAAGDAELALSEADYVIAAQPRFARAHFLRGVALRCLDRETEAGDALTAARDIAAETPSPAWPLLATEGNRSIDAELLADAQAALDELEKMRFFRGEAAAAASAAAATLTSRATAAAAAAAAIVAGAQAAPVIGASRGSAGDSSTDAVYSGGAAAAGSGGAGDEFNALENWLLTNGVGSCQFPQLHMKSYGVNGRGVHCRFVRPALFAASLRARKESPSGEGPLSPRDIMPLSRALRRSCAAPTCAVEAACVHILRCGCCSGCCELARVHYVFRCFSSRIHAHTHARAHTRAHTHTHTVPYRAQCICITLAYAAPMSRRSARLWRSTVTFS